MTTMEVVLSVVFLQPKGVALQGKLPIGYPVAISADQCSKIRVFALVLHGVIETKDHIPKPPLSVRDRPSAYDPAVVQHIHFHPVSVGQSVFPDFPALEYPRDLHNILVCQSHAVFIAVSRSCSARQPNISLALVVSA